MSRAREFSRQLRGGVAGPPGGQAVAAPAGGGRHNLADLTPGTRARVIRVVAPDAPATARRLSELGFTPGTEVEVVRRAPLHDPVVYRVKDYEICLRRAQARCVDTECLSGNCGSGTKVVERTGA